MPPKKQQHSFTMKTNNSEGQEFLDALDRVRVQERPTLGRSDMLRKLVFEADRKRKGK